MTNQTPETLVGALPAEVLIGLFVGALITVELLRKLATNIEQMKLLVAVKQALAIVSIVLLFATTGAVLVLGYSYVREKLKPTPTPVIFAPEVKPPAAEPASQQTPPCQRRPRKKKAKPPPLVQKSLPSQAVEWSASSQPSTSLSISEPPEAAPAPDEPAPLPPAAPELV
jgi:hypothetical protein